jgi:hypothetical protein
MPAKGKTNASRVQVGERILVQVTETGVRISDTKTGEGVQVARVTGKSTGAPGRARMTYTIHTSAGDLRNLAPIQTMILAPEDAAGIKRAHVEAMKEAEVRNELPAVEPELGFQKEIQEAKALDASGPLAQSLIAADHAEALELEAADLLAALEDPTQNDAVTEDRQAAAERWIATEGATFQDLEADQPEDGLEVPTKESTLAAIGGCWTGGTYTGHALAAWRDGDYASAMTYVNGQKALQATADPEALLPDHRERMTQAETLGEVAAAVLDLSNNPGTQAYRELEAEAAGKSQVRVATLAGMVSIPRPGHFRDLVPGVAVAPIGDPAPTAEDLSDLALDLAAEDLEHIGEGDPFPAPGDPVAVTLDVVTIHRGDRLYEVIQLDGMSQLDGMARVAPCDPEDHRDPFWVSLDLLHVRPPVAYVATQEITERVRQTTEVFTLDGEDRPVHIRTVLTDSRRLPYAVLIPSWSATNPTPSGHLRSGEALIVDGRTFRVLDLEGDGKLGLEPASWRARLMPKVDQTS